MQENLLCFKRSSSDLEDEKMSALGSTCAAFCQSRGRECARAQPTADSCVLEYRNARQLTAKNLDASTLLYASTLLKTEPAAATAPRPMANCPAIRGPAVIL